MYLVISHVKLLKQKVKSITIIHDEKTYPRTVNWQKEDGKHFNENEANVLKAYLDRKASFTSTNIQRNNGPTTSALELLIVAKDIADGRVIIDSPIYLEQCEDLRDYDLPFTVIGFFNPTDLT